MTADAGNELRALSRDIGRVGAKTAPALKAVVEKGALNIKEGMRADLEASKSFKRVALDVTYDIESDDEHIEAIIGPVVGKGKRHAGPLGSTAYFGGANGGGGKVRDPQDVLDEEEPRFNAAIDVVIDAVLGVAMSVHIDALVALAPDGVTVYDTDVPERPTFPYIVIEAPAFREDAQTLSRAVLDVDDYFTVRSVGANAKQARWAQAKSRLAYDRGHPDVDGFNALVTLNTTSPVMTDRDVTLEVTGHPSFAVDRYRYRATPA